MSFADMTPSSCKSGGCSRREENSSRFYRREIFSCFFSSFRLLICSWKSLQIYIQFSRLWLEKQNDFCWWRVWRFPYQFCQMPSMQHGKICSFFFFSLEDFKDSQRPLFKWGWRHAFIHRIVQLDWTIYEKAMRMSFSDCTIANLFKTPQPEQN